MKQMRKVKQERTIKDARERIRMAEMIKDKVEKEGGEDKNLNQRDLFELKAAMKLLEKSKEERVRLALTNAGTLKIEDYEAIHEHIGFEFRISKRSRTLERRESKYVYDGERPLKTREANINQHRISD